MTGSTKAIFLDIDGTLIWEEHTPPCDADIEALRMARARGHYVFINTGRSQGIMPAVLMDADYLDGYLMGCGTHLVMKGETVFADVIPPDVVNDVLAAFWATEDRRIAFEGEDCDYLFRRVWEPHKIITSPDDFKVRFPHARITKLTVSGRATDAERKLFAPYFDLLEQDTYYEVVLKGHGKGRGMQRVCEMLGVPMENSIAVGDSVNDLDMVCAAGVGVAMANASQVLLDAADMVTGKVGEGGVAQAVRKLMLEE